MAIFKRIGSCRVSKSNFGPSKFSPNLRFQRFCNILECILLVLVLLHALYPDHHIVTGECCIFSFTMIFTDRSPPWFLGDYLGAAAEPIPDSNIGNRLLQSMGWTPGTGLGPDGTGIKDPISALKRRDRVGLGYQNSVNPSMQHQPTSKKS